MSQRSFSYVYLPLGAQKDWSGFRAFPRCACRLGDVHNMVVPCFRMEFGEKLSEAGDGINKLVLYLTYLTASWSVLSMGGHFVFHSVTHWRM